MNSFYYQIKSSLEYCLNLSISLKQFIEKLHSNQMELVNANTFIVLTLEHFVRNHAL